MRGRLAVAGRPDDREMAEIPTNGFSRWGWKRHRWQRQQRSNVATQNGRDVRHYVLAGRDRSKRKHARQGARADGILPKDVSVGPGSMRASGREHSHPL